MNHYYNVRPRYTGGSPAMVDERTALRVAKEEYEAHERHMEGVYGPDEKIRADREGVFGIVEQVAERSDAWIVLDIITGDKYVRPFEPKKLESPIAKQCRYWKLSRKYGFPTEDVIKLKHVKLEATS